MNRQNIIVLTEIATLESSCDFKQEAWGSLTECCKAHGFPYHSLKAKKYPFEYEDWHFKKVSFRTLANER